jgi:hypothetical protein
MAGAAAAEVEQEDEDWDERVVKRRGGEAGREWWEAGEKQGAGAEEMSAWWGIEWLPKVRARNKCTVVFPPSPVSPYSPVVPFPHFLPVAVSITANFLLPNASAAVSVILYYRY